MVLRFLNNLKVFGNLFGHAALFAAAASVCVLGPAEADEAALNEGLDVASIADLSSQPAALLVQGQTANAWKAARDLLAEQGPSADLLVISGKSALARAKSAPLLSKKRWAKRGRNAYAAALQLDPSNAEALLGLATFALRAPDGLGGGDAAFAEYRERLLGVSAPLSVLLAARTEAQDDLESALDHYEIALSQLESDGYIAEYLTFADRLDAQARAYDYITSGGTPDACTQYYAGALAGKLGQSADIQLAHYMAFLASKTLYCNRKAVFGDMAAEAIRLAGTISDARLETVKQRLAEIQGGNTPPISDESSR